MEVGGGVADVEGAVVGEGGLEVDAFFRGDAETEARAEERGDGSGGDGVERAVQCNTYRYKAHTKICELRLSPVEPNLGRGAALPQRRTHA